MKNADISAYPYIRMLSDGKGGADLASLCAEAFFAARGRVVAALFLIYNKKP